MDRTARVLERTAIDPEDKFAERLRIADAIRRGEIPVGAIVTLDGNRNPRASILLNGRFQIMGEVRRDGQRILSIRRLGLRGRLLTGTVGGENHVDRTEIFLRGIMVNVEAPIADTTPRRGLSNQRAPEGAPIVREFSRYGPCLTLGPLIRETARFYVYENGRGGSKRIAKDGGAHITICRSCQDHPETHHPDGYLD